jgi:hypothetical protein
MSYFIRPRRYPLDGWMFDVVCAHTRRVRLVCMTISSALDLMRGVS